MRTLSYLVVRLGQCDTPHAPVSRETKHGCRSDAEYGLEMQSGELLSWGYTALRCAGAGIRLMDTGSLSWSKQ
jgi:hypothetical protein